MSQLVLEPGTRVSYAGFGPGEVIEIATRQVAGRDATFAVIEIPHNQMKVQLPLDGEPGHERVRPLISVADAKRLSTLSGLTVKPLSSEWTSRRDRAQECLGANDAHAWAQQLVDYAAFARLGNGLAVSDHDLIDRTISALASECAFALGKEHLPATTELREIWRALAETSGPSRKRRRRSNEATPASAPVAAAVK